MIEQSIWPIEGTVAVTTHTDLSEFGSYGNERVLHIPETSRIGESPSDTV